VTEPSELLPWRVAVLGFARSGRALASALLDRGVEVSVGDRRPEGELGEAVSEMRRRGARFFLGEFPPESLLEGAGWLGLSPGVPASAPVPKAARSSGIPVLAELEIAWRIAQKEAQGENRWVAVTGTNGKSTTTAWIADLLRRAGRPVALAGNIGVPVSAFLADRSPRDFVCEVSSFQLETVSRFRPDVAVVTNVTPDHLDRHGSFEAYARAKARVFENQRRSDFAVVNIDDEGAAGLPGGAGRRVPFSRHGVPEGGAGVAEGWLVSEVGGQRRQLLPAQDLALPGTHNVENALAAVAAADCLGAPLAAVREGLLRFEGLPHRTEIVAEGGGVTWVNDSKGTNVDATAKALEGFPDGHVILILGGRDKQGEFGKLARLARRRARLVLTIGEAAGAIERALAGATAIERSETMEKAVERAAAEARHGDTVLLSPACASFDQYANFEERGEHFTRLARRAAERVRRGLEGDDGA
jgi:UDP-N-acetylmuramoylalanine--D-glutamate ligase